MTQLSWIYFLFTKIQKTQPQSNQISVIVIIKFEWTFSLVFSRYIRFIKTKHLSGIPISLPPCITGISIGLRRSTQTWIVSDQRCRPLP